MSNNDRGLVAKSYDKNIIILMLNQQYFFIYRNGAAVD